MYGLTMVAANKILRAWWRASGKEIVEVNTQEAAVHGLERQYGVTLPEDFRAYLLDTAPKEDFWDKENSTWWPISRIRSISEEYECPIQLPFLPEEGRTSLVFADYLMWSWAWAICCNDGPDRGKVALIGGSPDRFVSASFTMFVEAYVAQPTSVF